jgi:hypoxanthine phosphoribosyltransferase
MHDRIRCELVSWAEVHRLARRLAFLIHQAAFKPDVVVAIARGGYVPARLVCDYLDIGNLTGIRIVHYTAGAQRHKLARLTEGLGVDVHGQRVLIVDDVSDTGDTLGLARDHVADFGPADVRVGVLHHKQVSAEVPDYYAHKVMKWRWITYPWAVIEDVSGFVARMRPRPHTPREARRRLNADYSIKVSERIIEDVFALTS